MLSLFNIIKIQKELDKSQEWQSLNIDYDNPKVERLWKILGNYRLYLHKIYNCQNSKPLLHKHPWPCAVKLYEGSYEMGIGYSDSDREPEIVTKLILEPRSSYQMLHQNEWHYVKPLTQECYSIMISGVPYSATSSAEQPHLSSLDSTTKETLLNKFRNLSRIQVLKNYIIRG